MATVSGTYLSDLNVAQSALGLLTSPRTEPAAKAAISDALKAALKMQLASAAERANTFNLADLFQEITSADIVAARTLSIQEFAKRYVVPPADTAEGADVEEALVKLSSTITISDALHLAVPISANPILANIVKMADMATLLETARTLAANPKLIDDFVAACARFKGSWIEFWNVARANEEFRAAIDELQFAFQLGALTRANVKLVSVLRLRHPRITSARDLTVLSVADWQELISSEDVTAPLSISGATKAEKTANYAAAIVSSLKEAFAGSYFIRDLSSHLGRPARRAASVSANAVDDGLAVFLNNAADFDILNTNISQYLKRDGHTAFKEIDATMQRSVASRLATWQRLARVKADFSTAHTLMEAGYASAHEIARTSRTSFVRKLVGALGSAAQAEAIYGRAQQIAGTTIGLIGNIRQAINMSSPRAIGDLRTPIFKFLARPGAALEIPNWQTLFGSLSSCACTDCRSVYSAAAYFVDLLQFLEMSGTTTTATGQTRTPLDVLAARRPDLPYVKLNCENTNTELPYVDLVNEILEGFIVLHGKLDRSVAHNTAKDATAAELSVNPEYVNDDAYNSCLNVAVYPPDLPFDRWLETSRAYLAFFGSGLHQVMSACQTGGDAIDFNAGTPSGVALACECLNISAAECVILTGKTFSGTPPASPPLPPALYQYYGYAAATGSNGQSWELDVAGVQNDIGVENFLRRTAIEYGDLVALLRTRALNPTLSIMLQAPDLQPGSSSAVPPKPGAACDLTQTTIVDLSTRDHALQDAPTLSLLHRFIRLWKKLGWSIEELDKTMTALQATDIDQQFVVSLAAIKELQAALELPLLPILNFWSDLDADGRSSLYLTLFQNKAVLNPPDPAFALHYVAPLAAVPLLQFPSPLFPNLSYDATKQQLAVHGAVGNDEYAGLISLSTSDAGYVAAITQLHQSSSPDPSASLARLPTATLPVWLSFDPIKHQIGFDGAMSDDKRAALNFSNDIAYQTGVDAIYGARTFWGTEVAAGTAPSLMSDHINQIIAALRISAQDLARIRIYTDLDEPKPSQPSVPLTVSNLSRLSRYATFARGLNLSVEDLFIAIALYGADPFQQNKPAQTLAFVHAVRVVQASPFSFQQLNYIYRHEFDPNGGIAPLPDNISLLLAGLQKGLAGIVNDTAEAPDPKGDLLVKHLATLFGSKVASAALGLITGTAVYSAPLAELADISLPPYVTYSAPTQTLIAPAVLTDDQKAALLSLSTDAVYQAAVNGLYAAARRSGAQGPFTQPLAGIPSILSDPKLTKLTTAVIYDGAAQQLRFRGAMSGGDQSALMGASTTNSPFTVAVQSLHQQPIDFIANNFAVFLDVKEAIKTLINTPALTGAEKIDYVTQKLMPYLQQTLCRSLVTQTLCDNLGLQPKLASLLLNNMLKSQLSQDKMAMADFLAMLGDGLLATYSDSGLVKTEVDQTVNFDWGFTRSGLTKVSWLGWVMPQYSETYTFSVQASGATQLHIDGKLLIDDKTGTNNATGTIDLKAGQLYQIELDYSHNAPSAAAVSLSWQSQSTAIAIIPQSQLFSGKLISSLTPVINAYTLLYKFGLFVSAFVMTSDDVDYMHRHIADFVDGSATAWSQSDLGTFFPNNLPLALSDFKPALFGQWLRLSAIVGLKARLPGGDAGLLTIFDTASSAVFHASSAGRPFPSLAPADPLTIAITQATGWNSDDLLFLAGARGFGLTCADFRNEIGTRGTGLVRLSICFGLLSLLGINAEKLFAWSTFGSDIASNERIAKDIQSCAKSKYDDPTWLTVGKPLNDVIRDGSRQAMVAYILGNADQWALQAPDGGTLSTADQLYELFLIDVDMGTCMLTSRIVQASAAVQLFVQRCLLGLEASVPPSAIDVTHWEWMKNFRVWQANRQIFLYPENWMVPELRDDKTPFFEDLESALLQSPVTADNVTQAYLNYLNALNEVALLDVRATCLGPAPYGDHSLDVLHVFGRTTAQPYKYYYRRLMGYNQAGVQGGTPKWTPWEAIGLDIEGDHLVPVIWDGRLYLFWAKFTLVSDPSSQNEITLPKTDGSPYVPPQAGQDVQVSIYWSEYRQGLWTSKFSSAPFVTAGGSFQTLDTSRFHIASVIGDDDSLTISIYNHEGYFQSSPHDLQESSLRLGYFYFAYCGSVPSQVQTADRKSKNDAGQEMVYDLPAPNTGLVYNGTVANSDTKTLQLFVPAYQSVQASVLGDTPNLYKLIYPQTFGYELPATHLYCLAPWDYFFQDNQRAYYVSVRTPLRYTHPYDIYIQFNTFFHPHVPTFIKNVDRYGLPGFLTLSNQALTKDNGIIYGFVLSPNPNGAVPGLSPGLLSAQGQIYEAATPVALPSAPLNIKSYIYYNSNDKFYYLPKATPIDPTDAFIGAVTVSEYVSLTTGSTQFELTYQPDATYITPDTFPHENVDFTATGAYSIYNWELFFHIPLLIATRLSQNQQFEEAQRWFHYIFNPTTSSDDAIPQRYWTCLPFYECSPWDQIQGQIQNILTSPTASSSSPIAPNLCGQGILDQIAAWQSDPFSPFAVGRMRTIAFRMKVVMAYLDNLIAWGDNLFAQNTRESINEATQIYILADEILGPRPTQVPPRGSVQDYTYNDLTTLYGIDEFSIPVQMENDFPYLPAPTTSPSAGLPMALSMSSIVPYFCAPANDKLLGYWDTVGDRFYKIRHCMNIQGVVEQLPLFAPPISPAMLVAAQASGVDLSSVLNNTNSGTSSYRFNVIMQKALDLCDEVRSLGAKLLSALEKQDDEALSLLRATQETSLLKAMQQTKALAVQESQATLAGLQASLVVANDRKNYYQTLISSGLNPFERSMVDELTQQGDQLAQSGAHEQTASSLSNIPSLNVGISGFGGSPQITSSFGGPNFAAQESAVARYFSNVASRQSVAASLASTLGQWDRRSQEWAFQLQSVNDEITEITARIAAGQFRVTIAQDDQSNFGVQIDNAQTVQSYLTGKYTGAQLYSWMIGQISDLYLQSYKMAYDLATRAEAGYRFERGLTTSSYIQFGYWDSLKKGLLAGDGLYADLKRLEIAYQETDVREYEISKSISLVLFDPWALINLKETGQCVVSLPEAFFDLDYPGHYFRRIKTVSLTIPCVTGPYSNVNCTLTLLNSKIRVDASPSEYSSDAHFVTSYAVAQSIATSTAQNDNGLFEVNFRDERYLPFEGAGLISTWRIDMPVDCNTFDFSTISDAIVNLRYTARYGGDKLRDSARKFARIPPRPQQSFSGSGIAFPVQVNLQRLFSLKHEYPTEWYRFIKPPGSATSQTMEFALDGTRFPFQYRGKTISIAQAEIVLLPKDAKISLTAEYTLTLGVPGQQGEPAAFGSSPAEGCVYGTFAQVPQPLPSTWVLTLTTKDGSRPFIPVMFTDIFLLCDYKTSGASGAAERLVGRSMRDGHSVSE